MKIIPTTAHRQAALRLVGEGGDEAVVLVQGAHLISWCPVVDGTAAERLYLSPRSRYGPGTAIRGGVPVIFPQFNRTGPDQRVARHGFARTVDWQVAGSPGGTAWTDDELTLHLDDGRLADGQPWPYRFRVELGIRLTAGALELRLTVVNQDSEALPFSAALHSYFAVTDAAQAVIEGLGGISVSDRVEGRDPTPTTEAAADFRFRGEVDRIYLWPGDLRPAPLTLTGGPSPLRISQQGFDDTVVWNPGSERARALDDLPEGGHRHYVCIEAAKATRPVTLAAGSTWTGFQRLVAQAGPDTDAGPLRPTLAPG